MQINEYNSLNRSESFRYEKSPGSITITRRKNKSSSRKFTNIWDTVRSVFLPEGYPDTVSDDYIVYQFWDTIQAFASSISGSLATQAVLEGVGVGDENASPLAATLTWLMRHGAGMVGQILFTFCQGSDLDHNCKKWRLFADILNDSAMLLELSGPLWPVWSFQLVLCTAGVCRALVGVAGGATRTAITQHQARANNISDVAAKDGSQETIVNLVALLLNLMILPLLAGDANLTWIVFILLTCSHLFANYKAVKSLNFKTLNRDRLLLVLQKFCLDNVVPGPKEINDKENVFLGFGLKESEICGCQINIGLPLYSVISKVGNENFVVNKIGQGREIDSFVIFETKNSYDVIAFDNFGKSDCLRAYLKAFFLAYEKNSPGRLPAGHSAEAFLQELQSSGWNTSLLQVNTLGWLIDAKKTN